MYKFIRRAIYWKPHSLVWWPDQPDPMSRGAHPCRFKGTTSSSFTFCCKQEVKLAATFWETVHCELVVGPPILGVLCGARRGWSRAVDVAYFHKQ